MNIILKTTLKNTFGKPLRTLLVVFSIFICTFMALFTFDIMKTSTDLIENMLSESKGAADMSVDMNLVDTDRIPEDFPEYSGLIIRDFYESFSNDIEGEYAYVTMDQLAISATDPAGAMAMGYLDTDKLGDNEAIITDSFAKEKGYKEGDKFTVHDMAKNPHKLTIVKIVEEDVKSILRRGNHATVNNATGDILCCNKPISGSIMIDLKDNDLIDDAYDMLVDDFGKENVYKYSLNEDSKDVLGQLFSFLFLLFAITFLLLIFITFSICDRIVGERMSFIGTLRSLGLSSGTTAVVLLLENVTYALFGSIPGTLLYLGIRSPMYATVFNPETLGNIKITIPEVSPALVITVILSAILIECLVPLKSVLKALNTSIRDIIFDNRDTAYKMHKSSIVVGTVMAILAVITAFFSGNLLGAAICLIASVMALAFLFPLILKTVSKLIGKLARKSGHEKLRLASIEAISRKSTVGSGVLCATSAAMCVIIYIISMSMMGTYNTESYDCDVVVTCAAKASKLSFVEHMDNITDTEFVYGHMDSLGIEGEDKLKIGMVFGMPENGFRFYHAIGDLPNTLEEGTICLESGWAKRRGYNIGDQITLTFDKEGVFPIEKTFSVASFFKISPYDGLKNPFVVSLHDYKSIYHDNPKELLVRTSTPEETAKLIESYAGSSVSAAKTKQEIIDAYNKDVSSSVMVYNIIIIVALAMTCIGIINNQIIGFEGRKKECAVMLSTSMSNRTLSGILFKEILITSLTSATAGCVLGTLLTLVLKKATESAEILVLNIDINPKTIFTLWISMTALFALTVLFPIRNLRKMKLSEQIKYE
ncbi:ABC transporter permease [Butyrivibrio sp. VCD2006]|uniref:ABC transporter permease n=1 Tax=Butyrivibrio sp. VCD2006 TaxID=1280664 RepID=UPI00040C0486|nr:ABC transporter permease [Butyrivibrio sp. VCD2006]